MKDILYAIIARSQPEGFKCDFVNPVKEVDKTIVNAIETYHDKPKGAAKIGAFLSMQMDYFKNKEDSHACKVLENSINKLSRISGMIS
jgi:hypothetical protein